MCGVSRASATVTWWGGGGAGLQGGEVGGNTGGNAGGNGGALDKEGAVDRETGGDDGGSQLGVGPDEGSFGGA